MLKDPYRWSDEYKQWVVNNDKFAGGPGAGGSTYVNGVPVGGPGQIPHSDRSLVGQPTGSYHGRDGMIRYNIHPWAEIYQQLIITDALLEMGRDFHEVQQVLSSLEIECNTGIFKNNTPTIVEPFGYNETGNLQFQLNQPHGSHLAELISPRIINYRPTGLIPPGNAPGIKLGGPGQAFCTTDSGAGGSGIVIVRVPGSTSASVAPGSNSIATLPGPAAGCKVSTFTVSGTMTI